MLIAKKGFLGGKRFFHPGQEVTGLPRDREEALLKKGVIVRSEDQVKFLQVPGTPAAVETAEAPPPAAEQAVAPQRPVRPRRKKDEG